MKQDDPNAAYTMWPHNGQPSPYSNFGYDHTSGYGGSRTDASVVGRRPEKRIWGCPVIVFVLSLIIAFLSAAVVGLAAGTGVQASRASRAEAKLASAGNTTVNSTSSDGSVDLDRLDRGCSSDSTGVSRTKYSSPFWGKPTYEIWCNSDAPNPPLLTLFVPDFDGCMDACASWSDSAAKQFPGSATNNNRTCAGVSFIPAWTDRDLAVRGTAPGNCYLKPGPQNTSALTVPNIGQECHAAIVSKKSS